MIPYFAVKMTFANGEAIQTKIALFKSTPQKTIDWLNGNGTLYELSDEQEANAAAEVRKKAGL